MTLSAQTVSPAEIQNTLNRLWESLETKNVARACLFNLIFYTRKAARAPYVQKIAQKVVEKFPSRVILITVDKEGKEDRLSTQVSILSSSKGEFDVACDYIQIDTSGTCNERVPFLVLPHILADLPVYLVWAEDPAESDPRCLALAQFATRLIFDSESTDNLSQFAASLLEHMAQSQCEIADLNWARIESWREMLSVVFHPDEHLEQIQRAKKIRIACNAQGTPFFSHTRIQALYLQAWLAGQLGWQFQSRCKQGDVHLFAWKGSAGPIEVTLSCPQHAELPPGLILSVDVETIDEEHFCFRLNQHALHQIDFHHSTPTKCDLPAQYIFSKAESGHSLVKEICHRGTSEHFLKVLHLVKQMDMGELC